MNSTFYEPSSKTTFSQLDSDTGANLSSVSEVLMLLWLIDKRAVDSPRNGILSASHYTVYE
jgi:hypothetical protein